VDGGGYQPGKMAEALAVSTFGLESMQESRSVVALKTNPKNIAAALKELKDLLLNQPRRPNVVEAGGESKEKLVLLNPALVPSRETIPAQCEQFAKEKGGEYVDHVVTTSYAHYSFDDVLKKLLPAGVEAPASFETIGHIAHLNLRPPHEPYRLLIAQVMIDKYSAIKTVVHKTGNITNEFRVFSMEILADKQTGGSVPRMAEPCDPALEATVKQSGCVFKLNFGDVYWNSRLEGEHARLVSTFKTGDVIWDLMGGIGPFAVPAAKMERCVVHANDLNPRSHHYLVENIRVNKVEKLVTPHCMCARAFLRHMVKTCGSEVPVSSGAR
jgi:tRNA (guanine37-N1)-methyltransferase